MKKNLLLMIVLFIMIFFGGCSHKEDTPKKLSGYKIQYDLIKEDGKLYYEAEGSRYNYLINVTGRSNNAKYDSYYIVLTNHKNVTFKDIDGQFWSSNKVEKGNDLIVEYGLLE